MMNGLAPVIIFQGKMKTSLINGESLDYGYVSVEEFEKLKLTTSINKMSKVMLNIQQIEELEKLFSEDKTKFGEAIESGLNNEYTLHMN